MDNGRMARVLRRLSIVGLLGVLTVVSSPSGSLPAQAVSRAKVTQPGPQRPCGVRREAPKLWAHVVWIVIENRGVNALTDANKAPYLASVAAKCGLATNMRAITHPSLPNYIAMTTGSTLGFEGSGWPSKYTTGARSIFSQVGPKGWWAYNQSMPANCYAKDSGAYAVRHNPAAYLRRIADSCQRRDVPIGSKIDLSARFTMITPDLDHDMHDGDVRSGDAYLAQIVPQLLATRQYRRGDTAIFITADEDEGTAANRIATFVIAPTVRPGTRTDVEFTHYSLLKTTEQLLGLGELRNAATARSMRAAFNLRRPRR